MRYCPNHYGHGARSRPVYARDAAGVQMVKTAPVSRTGNATRITTPTLVSTGIVQVARSEGTSSAVESAFCAVCASKGAIGCGYKIIRDESLDR